MAAVAFQDIVQLVNYPSVVLIVFIWLKHNFHPFGSFVDLTVIDRETFDSSFIYRDRGLTFSTASRLGEAERDLSLEYLWESEGRLEPCRLES